MLSFFKKKAAKSEEAANGKTMKAYLTGKVIPIEEVNDGVFSAKIMGDGIAIIPENEVLTAPAAECRSQKSLGYLFQSRHPKEPV